jgi:hypothetical protein
MNWIAHSNLLICLYILTYIVLKLYGKRKESPGIKQHYIFYASSFLEKCDGAISLMPTSSFINKVKLANRIRIQVENRDKIFSKTY